MKELKEQIKNNDFERCYVFYGSEDYLKKKYENVLKKSIVSENSYDMNYNFFEGKSAVSHKIIDSCETLPFLCEKRFVIVKNSGFFVSGKKEESESIVKYIENIPKTTCLLFIEAEVDKRGKLYKMASKFGKCIEFKAPEEKELVFWIINKLKKYNIKINQKNAVYFLRAVGSGMDCIENELYKLISFKNDGGEVLKQDVDDICIKSFEAKIFDLVGALGEKKTEKAINIYKNMILMKESPFMILSMITRQFRLILQCGVLKDEGVSLDNIKETLSIHPFVIRECIIQWGNFQQEDLKSVIEDCLEAEFKSKTGAMNVELATEMIIIKCSMKK